MKRKRLPRYRGVEAFQVGDTAEKKAKRVDFHPRLRPSCRAYTPSLDILSPILWVVLIVPVIIYFIPHWAYFMGYEKFACWFYPLVTILIIGVVAFKSGRHTVSPGKRNIK